MLITVEKVAILNSIPMFAGIPGYALAPVADCLVEFELQAGETFIQEGAVEDCLYIVVDGRVRVHSQEQHILTLGPGQTVGELAVLDPQPRSATVTTLDDTLLLRLNKEPFDEIMADRPEIAASVIQTLCHIIREQSHQLANLQEQDGS